MPPALDLQKFKKAPAAAPAATPAVKPAKPLDLNSFKKPAADPAVNPKPNISQMSGGYLRKTIPRITGAIAEDVKNAYEGVKQAGAASQKAAETGDIVGGVKSNLRAGLRAAAGGARAIFEPIAIPLSDAIMYGADKISDIPEVQRFAMSDKVGRIMEKATDTSISLGDFAKANPEQAQDVQDIVDILLTVAGTKTAKGALDTAGRGLRAVEDSLPAFTRTSLAAERSIGATESAAKLVLSGAKDTSKETIEAFRRYGIEPPVSAVTRSKAVQSAEAMAQTSMVGGSRVTQIVEKARDGIAKVAESLRKNIDAESMKTSGVSSESVGKELQTSLARVRKEFNDAKDKIYEDATKQIGDQQAVLDDTRAVLEDIVQQKNASLDPSAKAQANYFQELLNASRTAEKRTYKNIKATRTDIGKKLKNPTDPITTGDRANLARLYAALSKDLDATVSRSSLEAAAALKQADAFYKAGLDLINSVVGRTIFRSKSPETIVGKLIKPNSVTDVRNLKNLVGEQAFRQVSSLFMNNVIDAVVSPLTGRLNASKLASIMAKYGDDTLREVVGERGLQQLKDLRKRAIVEDILDKGMSDGKVQPQRMANAIESYDEAVLKEAFTPDELAKLRDVQKMSGAIGKGTRMADGSPTAEKAQVALNLVLGSISVPTLLTKIGLEWGLTKLFTTGWGRKLLTKGRLKKVQQDLPETPKNMPTGAPESMPPKGSVTRYSESASTPEAPQQPKKRSRYTGTEAFGADAGVMPNKAPAQQGRDKKGRFTNKSK